MFALSRPLYVYVCGFRDQWGPYPVLVDIKSPGMLATGMYACTCILIGLGSR